MIRNTAKANPHLSIVVPTYNRAKFLNYCLQCNLELARPHNIQVFIFDNASTDGTREMVMGWKDQYPFLHYFCNDSNIGPDNNFERALKHPDTEYVWLLGDTYQVPPNGINYVLDLVSKEIKYDMILLNVSNYVKQIKSQDYSDQNTLLREMFWVMTCLSALIYSSKLIANANFPRFRDTNFIQTGVIFEYIADRDFLIHWCESQSVRRILSLNGHMLDHWADNRLLEIWIRRRTNLILSLPASYQIETKFQAILDTSHLGVRDLLEWRASNILNIKVFKQYATLFQMTLPYSKFTVLFISLLPRFAVKLLKFFRLQRVKITSYSSARKNSFASASRAEHE